MTSYERITNNNNKNENKKVLIKFHMIASNVRANFSKINKLLFIEYA
jgi:hypothetical protein